MATLTSNQVASGVQPKGLRVGLVTVTTKWSAAVSISAGDVIQMVKVPLNATPIYVAISGNCGVGSANVGDGGSAARYINAYAFSAGAGLQGINTAYSPYTYETDDTIDITVSAVSLSSLVGGFNMIAIFTMDP